MKKNAAAKAIDTEQLEADLNAVHEGVRAAAVLNPNTPKAAIAALAERPHIGYRVRAALVLTDAITPQRRKELMRASTRVLADGGRYVPAQVEDFLRELRRLVEQRDRKHDLWKLSGSERIALDEAKREILRGLGPKPPRDRREDAIWLACLVHAFLGLAVLALPYIVYVTHRPADALPTAIWASAAFVGWFAGIACIPTPLNTYYDNRKAFACFFIATVLCLVMTARAMFSA